MPLPPYPIEVGKILSFREIIPNLPDPPNRSFPNPAEFPSVTLTQDMVDFCYEMRRTVKVMWDECSLIDDLAGVAGEVAFPKWMFDDWRYNTVGRNKGKIDCGNLELKASGTPMRDGLGAMCKIQYAKARQPAWYLQTILDVPPKTDALVAGVRVYLAGYCTHAEMVASVPGYWNTTYQVHRVPLSFCRPVTNLAPVWS